MPGSVIVGGARTPIGKAALERAGVSGDQVDYVIMGHVMQAGARRAVLRVRRNRDGAATETYTKIKNISRGQQDAFAAMSHGRAAEAQKKPDHR